VTTELLIIGVLAFLLAGTIKGTVGIGLPTLSISIMAQFVDPRVSIALLLIPALVTNTWQIYRGGSVRRSMQLLWPYALVMIVTMYLSALMAPRVSQQGLTVGIGIMVVLWTATSLVKRPARIPDALDRPFQLFAGFASGAIGGLTAIWSPPMVMYLLARYSDKEDFVRFTGFLILCGTVPLTLGYVSNGLMTRELALASAMMVVPTLVGFSIGERLRGRLNGDQFQKVVLCVFCLMGLNLIRRGLF
jgi:uncharacterized membrane protein YfcA